MQIEWLDSAAENLDSITDHLDPLNPVAAHRILLRIDQAVQKLKDFPFAGRLGRLEGTRELVVLRTPYIVVYSIEADHVAIVHVVHGAQQWPPEDE